MRKIELTGNFAEVAKERDHWKALAERAAELLLHPSESWTHDELWIKKRDQWLRDAGVEK